MSWALYGINSAKVLAIIHENNAIILCTLDACLKEEIIRIFALVFFFVCFLKPFLFWCCRYCCLRSQQRGPVDYLLHCLELVVLRSVDGQISRPKP